MKVIRILVTTLLLGATIAGFVGGRWIEEASGVITSYSATTGYSTWISMSHSSYYTVTQSVEYTRTMISITPIAGRPYIAQIGADGPCVKITHILRDKSLETTIQNLMNTRVKSGSYRITLYWPHPPISWFRLDLPLNAVFESIDVGASYQLSTNLPELWPERILRGEVGYLYGDVGIYLDESIRSVVGLQAIRTVSSVTMWSTKTYSSTYVDAYTMTRTFTIEEPFLAGTSTVWLTVILGAVGAIVAILFLKRKTKTTPIPASSKQATTQRVCSACGNVLQSNEDFCLNCGKKWK